MIPLKKAATSTIGQKFLMAFTGLGLVLFVIVHLVENLMLLSPNGTRYNAYAAGLASLGPLLYAAEMGLLALAIIHIILATRLKLLAWSARPVKYDHQRSKQGPSKSSASSRNLIVTGAVVLLFLVVHLVQFKFGAGEAQGYKETIEGHDVRDLYRLVQDAFHSPLVVGFYLSVMIFLAFHLKHGIWSAFQSLGATNSRTSSVIAVVGAVLAVLIGLGFFLIPIWVYFDLPVRVFGGAS
jgi:succinate dehydrogenase / fumarate reductase cytochrome b subunit